METKLTSTTSGVILHVSTTHRYAQMAKHHRHQYYTYVLINELGFYVGMSNNIPRRFGEHQAGECKTSSSIGNPLDLELVYIWTSPCFRLSSKLERFIHKGQRDYGNDYVLQIIDSMPIYTQEFQEVLDSYMPTTLYETQMEFHNQIQNQNSRMVNWGGRLMDSIAEIKNAN